jgi:hypothetical protein
MISLLMWIEPTGNDSGSSAAVSGLFCCVVAEMNQVCGLPSLRGYAEEPESV